MNDKNFMVDDIDANARPITGGRERAPVSRIRRARAKKTVK